MSRPFEAVLFDMDGLMIDSERMSLEAWRRAASELDMAGVDDTMLLGLIGLSVNRCVQRLETQLGDSVAALTLQRASSAIYWDMVEHETIPLKSGIETVLTWLEEHGVPRAVATSTQRSLVNIKLERCGLSRFFDAVVAGDEVARTKPAPDVYLAAAHKLGVDPDQCVVLEDSVYGMRAGLAAGMRVILVPDLVSPSAEDATRPHAVCGNLLEALDVLRAM